MPMPLVVPETYDGRQVVLLGDEHWPFAVLYSIGGHPMPDVDQAPLDRCISDDLRKLERLQMLAFD